MFIAPEVVVVCMPVAVACATLETGSLCEIYVAAVSIRRRLKTMGSLENTIAGMG
jgi:hypothetical protein